MRFCQPHWDSLREKVDKRGLTPLVADDGREAAHRFQRELSGERSVDTFDPLMGAHNVIASNAMQFAADAGVDPRQMFDAEAPDDVQCPVCFLNGIARRHDEECEDPNCDGFGKTFEWMLDRAADDMVEEWKGRGTS